MTSDSVITVPAFVPARSGVRHFFGTRRHAAQLAYEVGAPAPAQEIEGAGRSSWMLSVKQVHGTDALVVDRALTSSDRFSGGWDALVTDQRGIMVAVRTADCVPVLMHDPKRKIVAAVPHARPGKAVGARRVRIPAIGRNCRIIQYHCDCEAWREVG